MPANTHHASVTTAATVAPTTVTAGAAGRVVRPERLRPSLVTVRRLALAAVVANIAIVASGGLVRLTGSGLGCPSWPDCVGSSLAPTRQLSWHKYVEFGNRLFTYVVLAAVVAALVAVLRSRPRPDGLRMWAWLSFLGVPAQAVMGGISVLTDLNPWVVAGHFVLSMLLIAAATVLWWRARAANADAGPVGAPVHPLLRRLGWATWGLTYAVLCAGTVVTGSGPHAGDPSAPRIAIRSESVAQLHADLVMALVGMSFALAIAVTATTADRDARLATRALLGALALQTAIGFAQYFDKLPIGLVELHLLGAACIAAAATAVVLATGQAGPPARAHGSALTS